MGQDVRRHLLSDWARIRKLPFHIWDRAGANSAAWQGTGYKPKVRALAIPVSMVCAVVATNARADALPRRQAAHIEYARICAASDTGFFFIVGSGRCLQSAGLLPSKTREPDSFYCIAGQPYYLNNILGVSVVPRRNALKKGPGFTAQRQTAAVDKAFIRFAGLVPGRTQYMFDSYAGANNCQNFRGPGAFAGLLAYTATFGEGFSSAAFLGDPPSNPETGGRRILTSKDLPFGVEGVAGTPVPGNPAETRISEIVGNLRLYQAFDSARVPNPAQPQRASQSPANALATIAPFPQPAGSTPPYTLPALTSSSHGFALQDGVQANLDYLSPGDKLWLQAAYDKGAASDTAGHGLVSAMSSTGQNPMPVAKFPADAYGAGRFPAIDFNCVFVGSSKCQQQSSWDITGAYKNYWLPILKSTAFGSTLEVRNPVDAASILGGSPEGSKLTQARIEQSLLRSPIRGFDIGAEYMYTRLSQTRPSASALDTGAAAGGLPTFAPGPDAYDGRLRVQHGF